jgi:hypothetical protein
VRAAQTAGVLPGVAGTLWLPQLHVLTVGWLTQLIFGVAYWLFPRPSTEDWGSIAMWGAYGILNAGLVLRLICEPTELTAPLRSWGLVLAAGLQWGASLLLAGYFWRRVRTK